MPAPIRQTYDPEKFSVNTAWIKRGGEHFEVVVDPDAALQFKKSKGTQPSVSECLKAERIFTDAKRGLHAKDEHLKEFFGESDPLFVARTLILEGELQLTSEHRAQLRESKRHAIMEHIRAYAVDPRTSLPHPAQRLQLAMDEAKIKIDDMKDVEQQVHEIIRKLQPILPIRLETVVLQIHLPAPHGQKLYGELSRMAQLRKTEWLPDGSLAAWVELPAGLQGDLIDTLGKRTHGAADVRKVEEHQR
jgi:ribosome maturation protein SDO1